MRKLNEKGVELINKYNKCVELATELGIDFTDDSMMDCKAVGINSVLEMCDTEQEQNDEIEDWKLEEYFEK